MLDNPYITIPGVFSTQSKIPKRLDGVRIHAQSHKIYWYAEEDEQGNLTIQPLNQDYLPSGVRMAVTPLELSAHYLPEQEIYEEKVGPKLRQLNGILEKADELRAADKPVKAAAEYRRALSIDEENIRANFGAGLTYLAQGDKEKARDVFKRLLKLQGTFEKEHKHMFNEFGISMRKNKMFQEAVEYYGRALELTKDDENLYINMARPLCEQRKFASGVIHLVEALRIAPGNKMATDFLKWLKSQSLIPVHLELEVEKALAAKAPAPQQVEELTLPDNLFE